MHSLGFFAMWAVVTQRKSWQIVCHLVCQFGGGHQGCCRFQRSSLPVDIQPLWQTWEPCQIRTQEHRVIKARSSKNSTADNCAVVQSLLLRNFFAFHLDGFHLEVIQLWASPFHTLTDIVTNPLGHDKVPRSRFLGSDSEYKLPIRLPTRPRYRAPEKPKETFNFWEILFQNMGAAGDFLWAYFLGYRLWNADLPPKN